MHYNRDSAELHALLCLVLTAKLSPDQYLVYTAFRFDELSERRAATELGISRAKVRKRLAEALTALEGQAKQLAGSLPEEAA